MDDRTEAKRARARNIGADLMTQEPLQRTAIECGELAARQGQRLVLWAHGHIGRGELSNAPPPIRVRHGHERTTIVATRMGEHREPAGSCSAQIRRERWVD